MGRGTTRRVVEGYATAHDSPDRPAARDTDRDTWLREQEVEVIRLAAADILSDLDRVVGPTVRRCAIPLHQPAAGPPPHAAHGED
ncbi:hypothetical protein V5740_01355 [Croceibacterium sp. TMG7-5b_MA50]|uniref:hypothetical protein n=1 Tax=Croceibacterium sp. TMG7-5b_MA50 TaxID=3121290 RepID=UPI0032217E0C